MKKVLVLFSYRNHKQGYIESLFSKLSAAAQGSNIELHRGSLKDLRITIKNNKLKIVESMTKKNIADFDLVYFELWYKSQQQALAAALYLKAKNVPFFSEELLSILPISKIGELARLADNGVPLPDTYMSSNREIKKAFKKSVPPMDFPLIVKSADGYGGKNNFLVSNYTQLIKVLDEHKDLQFVIQEFVPNDCDYRCLIFGGEIKLVLKRTRKSNAKTHLNNTSAGAEGELVPVNALSENAQNAVLRAASVMGRSQFSGVDLMLHKETQQPYILEVNQTPQIEIGAEVDQKMKALLEYMAATAKEEKA
jgi:glutathione synthase/RimK-type ligase-like ATP-grasp enzyme